jgi:hypothetical protein
MNALRSTPQRKADVVAQLERNGDAWLATSDSSGRPHLIAVSAWWDGERMVIATTAASRTARNLGETRIGRFAVGSPDDAIMLDVELGDSIPVADAEADLSDGFAAAVGWNPADEGTNWRFFRLRPIRIQAYRGYGELECREVMRDGAWLA